MKNLARKFLSEQDRTRIKEAVHAAEKRTSGEIVPMVVSASYHYPMADITGAITLSLPISLGIAHFFGESFWGLKDNMFLFIAVLIPLFLIFQEIVPWIPILKRIFAPDSQVEEEVREAATTAFFAEGLYRTENETGVLIFISVFERRVWVLADRGINEKLPEDHWEGIVKLITDGIREKRPADAICRAVTMVADMLEKHFPIKPGDRDELPNLIIEDRG
ncbi:MAG: hypothetical protein GXP53_09025 [Deltaproteobacteria bacterium]|nr:hypothetical protein [Deltaproteobacteria bacterium]